MKPEYIDKVFLSLYKPEIKYPMQFSEVFSGESELPEISAYEKTLILEHLEKMGFVNIRYFKETNPKTGEKKELKNMPSYYLSYEGYRLVNNQGQLNREPYSDYRRREKINGYSLKAIRIAPILIAIIAILITSWQVKSDREKYDLQKANEINVQTIKLMKVTQDSLIQRIKK